MELQPELESLLDKFFDFLQSVKPINDLLEEKGLTKGTKLLIPKKHIRLTILSRIAQYKNNFEDEYLKFQKFVEEYVESFEKSTDENNNNAVRDVDKLKKELDEEITNKVNKQIEESRKVFFELKESFLNSKDINIFTGTNGKKLMAIIIQIIQTRINKEKEKESQKENLDFVNSLLHLLNQADVDKDHKYINNEKFVKTNDIYLSKFKKEIDDCFNSIDYDKTIGRLNNIIKEIGSINVSKFVRYVIMIGSNIIITTKVEQQDIPVNVDLKNKTATTVVQKEIQKEKEEDKTPEVEVTTTKPILPYTEELKGSTRDKTNQ